MNYLENLQTACIILTLTLFIMSWDYVPPTYRKLRKVFGK